MVRAGLQRRRVRDAGPRADRGDRPGDAADRAALGAWSRGEEGLVGVDRVYTALNKLGIVPLLVFVVAYPITNELDYLVRVLGFAPPRLERLIPGLHDNALASFLAYFVLYDFAAYWVHRAQHRFGWWWALHSLHHSQRRVTAWTDDRNHILDELLVNLVLAVFAQFVGVQPDDFVLILIVGRLVESFSHAGLDMGFGRLGARLLVAPRFHRLHHALADARDPHIHDHNFAPVFPIWDMLFGTARFDAPPRPTGVDDPRDRRRQRPRLARPAGAGVQALRRGPDAARIMGGSTPLTALGARLSRAALLSACDIR